MDEKKSLGTPVINAQNLTVTVPLNSRVRLYEKIWYRFAQHSACCVSLI